MKNSPITKKEQNKFLEVFNHYKVGQWIYPGALHRITHVPIEEIYWILDKAEKEKIVKSYFEIICGECKSSIGKAYKNIDDIPKEYICDNCGNQENAIENTVLIYRMLDNEKHG